MQVPPHKRARTAGIGMDGSLRRRTDKAFFVGMSDLHYANIIAGLRRDQEEGRKASPQRSCCGCCHCTCTSPSAPPQWHGRDIPEQAQSSEQSCRRPLQDAPSPHRAWSPVSRRRPTLLPQPTPPPPPPPKKPQDKKPCTVAWAPKGLDWSNTHSSHSSSSHSSTSGGRHEQSPSPPCDCEGGGMSCAVDVLVQDLVLEQRLSNLLHPCKNKKSAHRPPQEALRKAGVTGRQGGGSSSKAGRGRGRGCGHSRTVAPLILGINFPVGLERPAYTYRPPAPPARSPKSPPRPAWRAHALADARAQIRQRRQHRPWVMEGEGLGPEELVRALRGAGHCTNTGDEMVSLSRLRVACPSPHTHQHPTHTAGWRFSVPSSGSVWPCLSAVATNSPSSHQHHKTTKQHNTGGVLSYEEVVGVGTRASCPTHLLLHKQDSTLTALAHRYDQVPPTLATQPRTHKHRRKQAGLA